MIFHKKSTEAILENQFFRKDRDVFNFSNVEKLLNLPFPAGAKMVFHMEFLKRACIFNNYMLKYKIG